MTAAVDGSCSDVVVYEVADGVATLTLNRPDHMNAWNLEMGTAFYRLIDEADADPEVRVIVVTGAGRAFCSGADLGGGAPDADAVSSSGDGGALRALVGERQPVSLLSVRKPVIAAINGACAGFGLTIALMCDVRFVAEGARFTTAFARRGLVAEQGMSWILQRIVGLDTALDLLLTGRKFDAAEAAELGLTRGPVPVGELRARVDEYAADIVSNCSPWALAQIRSQVYADAVRGAEEATEASLELMAQSLHRVDVIEGITAFYERRLPDFPPLEGK